MDGPRIFTDIPEQAHLGLEDFLAWLGCPAIFHLPGADRSRCRVVSGGLHGNEPSGFYAIHELLKDPPKLAVDSILVLGNVPAALHELLFTHRFIPGEPDMNRVWGYEGGGPLHTVARRMSDYLAEQDCEAFVDLHNNSGHNPIYGVLVALDPERIALGRCWTHRFVYYSGKKLGTFLETCEPRGPGVVIECGRAGDPIADQRALAGARRYLSATNAFEAEWSDSEEAMFYHSIARIHVPASVQVAFDERRTVADLTVSPEIDRFNFRVMEAGTRLAFCNDRGRLQVIGNDGDDVTAEWLETRDGEIVLRRSMIPVMMTTDGVSAKQDCLLYVAERIDGRLARLPPERV